MSILIKGMEMPKDCGKCFVGNRTICSEGCPLIEVFPHGRLIDADAFVKEKQEWYCKQNCERRKGIKNGKKCFVYKIGEAPCRACEIDDLISAVEDAPTIIEAEGET